MPARSGLAVLDYPTAGQVFCEENRLERGRNRRYVGGKGICTGEARGGTSELATTVIGIGCYVSRPDVASEKRFRKCSESNSENVSETRSENQAHRRVAIQAST